MEEKNQILNRPNKTPILWDAFFNRDGKQKPLVIFCHGYKGFKDWGAWDLVAREFSKAGFFFVKFNFSHNGGTMEQPIDFPDLDAFAENNYSKELEDLDDVITHLSSEVHFYSKEINIKQISLIGHSRGGGIAILKASEDDRISQLVTWASVSDFGNRMGSQQEIEAWKNDGVKYVLNGRTKQQMPHNYQFYEDFIANEERLHIESGVKKIEIPYLIIHAKDDPSVNYDAALLLKGWSPNSQLLPIADSDHVFGASHPWSQQELPSKLQTTILETIQFIQSPRN
ncbi:MAG: alpha/beta hydrolase family protein [Aquaticitalea sp.]